MTEIEKVKGEIKLLQSKLEFLEELEKHKDQEVREAFKEVYGHYPMIDGNDYYRWEGKIWFAFQKGYEAAQPKDVEVNEKPKPQTLLEIIRDWNDDEDDPPCEVLVDMIVDTWLLTEEEPFSPMDKFADGWNSYREKLMKNLK